MKTAAVAALAAMVGCAITPPTRRAPGTNPELTPRHRVLYFGIAQDGPALDDAVDVWLDYWKIRGADAAALQETLSMVRVAVFSGETLDGNFAAYWWADQWIEIARDAPREYDRHMGLTQKGLSWLAHELTHALLRDGSHKNFQPQVK